MATIIYPNGKTLEVVPREGAAFTLEYLQGIVSGYIEIARLYTGELMILNEEGERLGLPSNLEASIRFNEGGRMGWNDIWGTVIVCSDIEAGEALDHADDDDNDYEPDGDDGDPDYHAFGE